MFVSFLTEYLFTTSVQKSESQYDALNLFLSEVDSFLGDVEQIINQCLDQCDPSNSSQQLENTLRIGQKVLLALNLMPIEVEIPPPLWRIKDDLPDFYMKFLKISSDQEEALIKSKENPAINIKPEPPNESLLEIREEDENEDIVDFVDYDEPDNDYEDNYDYDPDYLDEEGGKIKEEEDDEDEKPIRSVYPLLNPPSRRRRKRNVVKREESETPKKKRWKETESNDLRKCPRCSHPYTGPRVYDDHVKSCDLPPLDLSYDFQEDGTLHCVECEADNFKVRLDYYIHFLKMHCSEDRKTLTCDMCEKSFYNALVLKRHKTVMHKCKCQHCNSVFNSPDDLTDHLKEKHGDAYKCDDCDYTSYKRDHVYSHARNKHSGSAHKCPNCEKTFRSLTARASHIRIIHDKIRQTCHICGKSYGEARALKKHIAIKHEKRGIKCPKCSITYVDQESHDKTCGKKFMCDYCAKEFTTPFCLKKHILKLHSGDNPNNKPKPTAKRCDTCKRSYVHEDIHKLKCGVRYICDQCGKSYGKETALRTHIQTAHEGLRFSCPNCGSLHTKLGLQCHLREYCKAAGLNRHLPCPYNCGKTYLAQTELSKHIKKSCPYAPKEEDGEKLQLECPNCCQPINAKYSFEIHIKSCKLPPVEVPWSYNDENLLYCIKCPQSSATYYSRLKYHTHYVKTHVDERVKTVPCDICRKLFYNQMAMKTHKTETHKTKCRRCRIDFDSHDEYNLHIEQVHKKMDDDDIHIHNNHI